MYNPAEIKGKVNVHHLQLFMLRYINKDCEVSNEKRRCKNKNIYRK